MRMISSSLATPLFASLELYARPFQRCPYHCTISLEQTRSDDGAEKLSPVFKVSAADDLGHAIVGKSLAEVYEVLLQRPRSSVEEYV